MNKIATILQYAEKFFKLATEYEVSDAMLSDIMWRDELASIYSDVYKDKYGIKPRWMKFDDMTVAELKAELKRLEAEPMGQPNEPSPISEVPIMEGTVSPLETDEFETQPLASGMGKRR